MGKVVALDFDGTLVENCWPEIGAPIPETIAAYHKERGEGAQFVLWTCRTGEKLDEALAWCKSQGIDFEAVNQNVPEKIEEFGEDCRKVSADEYWDDRAVKMPAEAAIPIAETKKEAKAMPSIFRKPVQVDRGLYTMSMQDGQNAEITMYGQIVVQRPRDWWTDEPKEGDYIIQDEFMADLEKISRAKALTIRMNSLGGDAGVSILIHNRLRELAAKGMALTCIVDGVAMSGGSLIMAACDTVKVNPSSLIMIHKCWSALWGGYNADELREEAAACEAWDKAQASIYKRKCGLDEAEIARMMAATTYMTGQEAIDKGFADTLLEDAQPLNIAASADGQSLFVRGREFHLCPGMFAPDSVPTRNADDKAAGPAPVSLTGTIASMRQAISGYKPGRAIRTPELEPAAQAPARNTSPVAAGKGGSKMEDLTNTPAVEESPQHPAAFGQAAAERQRLKDIDAIAALYDPALVQAAKYGENPCTAQELAYQAAVQAAANVENEGKAFFAAMQADAKAAAEIGAAPVPEPQEPSEAMTTEQRMAAARQDVRALLGKEA